MGKSGFTIGLLSMAALAMGCSEPRTYLPAETGRTMQAPVLRERAEKDRAFKSDPNSPVPPVDRARFQGLAYFDLDPAFRFRLRFNRYPAPRQVRIGTNTGEIRRALRYGYFEFEVGGRRCRLQVYRMDEEEAGGPRLFIPFRDATTGRETYEAGRYLELPESTAGFYDLDFNRAFNPYCAYGRNFSCPVPPPENTLEVAIRAGEKTYPLAKDQRSE